MGPLILHLFLVVTMAIDGKDDSHARYGKWWEGEARESNRSLGEEGGSRATLSRSLSEMNVKWHCHELFVSFSPNFPH